MDKLKQVGGSRRKVVLKRKKMLVLMQDSEWSSVRERENGDVLMDKNLTKWNKLQGANVESPPWKKGQIACRWLGNNKWS